MLKNIKIHFRKTLLKTLRLFKFYRVYSLVPEGEIKYSQLNSAIDFLYLNEPQQLERILPLTVDGSIHPNFINQLNEIQPKTFVIKSKNWHVWGNQGAVITDAGYLFKDVSREFDQVKHSVFDQFKLIAAKNIKGLTAVLAASGGITYYHWLFDILPRINLLKKTGYFDSIDHFIINYSDLPFQKQTLERAGVDLSKIIVCNDNWGFHIQAEDLILPSLPSNNNSPSLEACLYLRELYKNELAGDNTFKKLYIKRPPGRCIINEDELLEILIPLGFEIIYPWKLTVAEQACFFSQAEIVAGIHGADFTNLVFCKPGTRVIDIFSPHWINPCYWVLSNILDLKYAYLIGEDSYTGENRSAKGANVLVDLSKFNKLLSDIYA
jgi:capsular polysaccharide biosynthesis protein